MEVAEINKKDIGSKIARGGDSIVYHYGKDNVIKFSKLFTRLIGKRVDEKLKEDYATCRKYLPDYVLEETFVESEKETDHIVIQLFIDGDMFGEKHAKNPELRAQLEEIVVGMKKLEADGFPHIDLVGNRGILSPLLSNIIVSKEGKLYIVDAVLMESLSMGFWGYVFFPFLEIVKARQRYLLKKFLGT